MKSPIFYAFKVITKVSRTIRTNLFEVKFSQKENSVGGFKSKMDLREALNILNLVSGQNLDKVKESHRRLLLKNHPDRGGSNYLSIKINEAKDLIIDKNN